MAVPEKLVNARVYREGERLVGIADVELPEIEFVTETVSGLGVAGEVILFASLVTAGMPFLLLVGAAPNAIAYDSKQFTTAEFFLYGIPASILLMAVTGFSVYVLWPMMGMSIRIAG